MIAKPERYFYIKKILQGVGETPQGDKYEGEWVNDEFCGEVSMILYKFYIKGTLKYADGSIYKGSWEKTKRHGHGELESPSGARYEGDWENDLKHGKVY